MSNNLVSVLKNLESSKATVRQEALSHLRMVFAQDTVIQTFHVKEDPDPERESKCDNWVPVFNALFAMVRIEKAAYTHALATGNQPKAPVVKRLAEGASTVRSLVERAFRFFNKRVLQVLLTCLVDDMITKNEMVTPIMLDYTKAIRCLISSKSHLSHLSEAQWVVLVKLGFNVVLGESPKADMRDKEDQEVGGDSFMYASDEDEDEEENDELPVLSYKRKRKPSSTPATPQSSSSRMKIPKRSSRSIRQISVSQEQVEFAAILSILLSFSGSPILSPKYDFLPNSILNRLERFIELYPAESSMLPDYLVALSSTLDQLALNKVHAVQRFARNAWDDLINLWGTKDKTIKENLLVVIRCLLPYLTADFGLVNVRDSFDHASALWKLYNTLEREADNRRGVEGLFLDSLRLEINENVTGYGTKEPFIAHTFRAGWNFDVGQAISWAVLEMQADCTAKLYQLSESMNTTGATPLPLRLEKKRKVENGISSVLESIQMSTSSHVRGFHLQVLLFFIDRHWFSLHRSLKVQITDTLLQLVTSEDATIQCWSFLSVAAIAYSERFLARIKVPSPLTSQPQSHVQVGYDSSTWDSMWTHSIRRINVPATCRTACHAAYALTFQGRESRPISLPTQRILAEIESLATDLEVQGPSYPYDSVCNFLAQCIALASQDVRLYRIYLEDKVISWLHDHWKVTGISNGKLMPHLMQDGIRLLEAACGISRKCFLASQILLPACNITRAIETESSEKVIQDFLLKAQLPTFEPKAVKIPSLVPSPTSTIEDNVRFHAADLTPPQPRERKVSTAFLRNIEPLTIEWENVMSNPNRKSVSAEAARQSLEYTVAALVFESLLVYNGVTANRHLVQGASKLISIIIPLLHGTTWSLVEKNMVLYGLEPLVMLDDKEDWVDTTYTTILPPGPSSGIKKRVYHEFLDSIEDQSKLLKVWRANLLRVLWQLPDAQECLQNLVTESRRLFCVTISGHSITSGINGGDYDERDGFGPIRTTATPSARRCLADDPSARFMLSLCMRLVAGGPLLRSASGEPTKDNEILEAIMACVQPDPDGFLLGFSLVLDETKRRSLLLSSHLGHYLRTLEGILKRYTYSRREITQQLVTQLLHALLESWIVNPEMSVTELAAWLLQMIQGGKMKYRTIRDSFIRFLERLVIVQPCSLAWLSGEEEFDFRTGLLKLIPFQSLIQDEDVRIRIRGGIFTARMFHAVEELEIHPSVLYDGIKSSINKISVDEYEQMLSRLLILGNIIVVSSAIRRGPYWHILETCFHSNKYVAHTEAVLVAASRQLGLKPLSFFEAHAAQMGYTIISHHQGSIAKIPPHLIGFNDRRQAAAFTLSAFASIYIATEQTPLFEAHCKLVGATADDIFLENFGEVVGMAAILWFKENIQGGDIDNLHEYLLRVSYGQNFETAFPENIDGIAVAIIRVLSNQDISSDGAIHNALRVHCSPSVTQTFTNLVKHRLSDKHILHEPNNLIVDPSVVICALKWLFTNTSISTKAITYHILHNLFAAIDRCPFVDEQLRLLNGLALWIALRHEDFKDATLLRTLVQGSTTLLAEYDLAHAAQSMLEWAFRLYREYVIKDSAFSNTIIRICSIAHGYTRSSYSDLQTLGSSLMEWTDNQALSLCRKTGVHKQVLRALPTWPYTPIPNLEKLGEEDSADALSSLLGDPKVTYNKFQLVRRLEDHAKKGNYRQSKFATSDFWQLKDCIPPRDELQAKDACALASLLNVNHGDIGGTVGVYQPTNSLFRRYQRILQVRREKTDDDKFEARDFVVYSLLQLLDDSFARNVFSGYETLRRVMAVRDKLLLPRGITDYTPELEYLQAFRRQPRIKTSNNTMEFLSSEDLLTSSADFSRWISLFSAGLSDCLAEEDIFFAQLPSILSSNSTFATDLLPVLVHAVLQTEIDGHVASKGYKEQLTKYFTNVLTSSNTPLQCRQSIIDIILHLRRYVPFKKERLSCNRWLDLDYMLLAQNAVFCGAYTTSLLFLELNKDHPTKDSQVSTSSEQLLYDIYSHIDEPDGFYGIETNDLHQFLLRRFHHEKQWDKALHFHGAAMEADPSDAANSDGLRQAFSSFGYNHLVMNTLRGSQSETSSSLNYKLAWRTQTWDLPDRNRNDNISGASLYFALRAINRERNPQACTAVIQKGLLRSIEQLRTLGPENMSGMRNIVREIICIKEVYDWSTDNSLKLDVASVRKFDTVDGFDFDDLETLMATRIALLQSARQKEERRQIGNMETPLSRNLRELEKSCLINLSKSAREANRVQIALNSVMHAQRLNKPLSLEIAEEYSNVLWAQNEQKAAVQYLKNVVDGVEQNTHHALLLARLGSWVATACLENPSDIWSKYWEIAMETLDTASVTDSATLRHRATVFHDCALFAEKQYQAIIKSPEGARLKVYVERKMQEIHQRDLEIMTSASDSHKRSLQTQQKKAQKILENDNEQFTSHTTARNRFLEQALTMYAKSLATADIYDDDAPIRFCSLWFANFESEENIQKVIGDATSLIPSHKFVFLSHQLTARLSSSTGDSKCQQTLRDVVLRMCRDHPFHSLYQVYCLVTERKITRQSGGRRQSSRVLTPLTPSNTQSERGNAARIIFDQLESDPQVNEKARDVENLCDACWEWAKFPIKDLHKNEPQRKQRGYWPLPAHLAINRINNLRVPVVTIHTPLDPTMHYDNCIWINSFAKEYKTAGGVNLPKIFICHGSDGHPYIQLFKGEGSDDLRQDAVMEQVFEVVNSVLRRDRETKRRELGVRGYKVIPLDSQAGLLEFVEKTVPLSNWLPRAHKIYHPTDLSQDDLRLKHAKAQEVFKKDEDMDKLLKTFYALRKQHRPIMRHYFTEKSDNSPVKWFAMRLKYTRSVAVTSIVGHITGLGDRHMSNILLDNSSGEVIHIDLGIAFDQGKVLPTPEIVPFRMTEDMVDGMGISGVHGVFQRCAEETLRVLRAGSDVIMTVLEVFKYDPLHSWKASDTKVKQVQDQPQQAAALSALNDTTRLMLGGIGIDMSSGSAEEAADRALSSVSKKLDKSLSVEYTINQLLADARDPNNLAKMFAGWSPHF